MERENLQLEKITANEIELMLEKETAKPLSEIDTKLVNELSAELIRAKGIEYKEPDTESLFREFIQKYGISTPENISDDELKCFMEKYSGRIKEYKWNRRKEKIKKFHVQN